MSIASDAEVRAWARGQDGLDVPERGKVGQDLRDLFDQAHGVTTASADDDEPAADMTEQAPRASRPQRPARARGPSLFDRARSARPRAAARPQRRRQAKRYPWVGTADVIEHFWSQLAWSARPIPPLQKILAAQAPMAGVILEGAAKDTWVDRTILQPVARLEDKMQAANAMLGPPVWTLLIATQGGAITDASGQPVMDEDGMFVFDDRTRVMVGGLRFSLMSWLKLADKKADEIIESAQELSRLGDEADQLIKYILSPVMPGQSPKQTEQEARDRGMAFVRAGQAPAEAPNAAGFAGATQDQVTGQLEQMAGASAFRPAPATGSK